ncbi:hypothetical protein QOT17_012762 [Balamuthia mandrillaris]
MGNAPPKPPHVQLLEQQRRQQRLLVLGFTMALFGGIGAFLGPYMKAKREGQRLRQQRHIQSKESRTPPTS